MIGGKNGFSYLIWIHIRPDFTWDFNYLQHYFWFEITPYIQLKNILKISGGLKRIHFMFHLYCSIHQKFARQHLTLLSITHFSSDPFVSGMYSQNGTRTEDGMQIADTNEYASCPLLARHVIPDTLMGLGWKRRVMIVALLEHWAGGFKHLSQFLICCPQHCSRFHDSYFKAVIKAMVTFQFSKN